MTNCESRTTTVDASNQWRSLFLHGANRDFENTPELQNQRILQNDVKTRSTFTNLRPVSSPTWNTKTENQNGMMKKQQCSIKIQRQHLYSNRDCKIRPQRRISAPIKCPLPNCDCSVDSTLETERYELATWAMYYRIRNARQANTLARRDSSEDLRIKGSENSTTYSSNNDGGKPVPLGGRLSHLKSLSREPYLESCTFDVETQKFDHEGVFTLDMDAS